MGFTIFPNKAFKIHSMIRVLRGVLCGSSCPSCPKKGHKGHEALHKGHEEKTYVVAFLEV